MIDEWTYGASLREGFRDKYFKSMTAKSFFEFMCGDYLGKGAHRVVFDCELTHKYPNCVVKISEDPEYNITEFGLWCDLSNSNHENKKWLAECHLLSEDGKILIQSKTNEIPDEYKFPERIPSFLTDIKKENFGLIKKQLVAHDYGLHMCNNYAMSKKMRSVKNLW